MKRKLFLTLLFISGSAAAHDTWVQTNTNLVRATDAVHIDLMLGNHGNEHRDFKLAGKVQLEGATLNIAAPDGKTYDLKTRLSDTGYTPQEGYWTTPFVTAQPGLYTVVHTYDQVMSYAPVRAIKSAKTFFVASQNLDRVPKSSSGFDRLFGDGLELVPETNPVTMVGPGSEITVRLYYKGKPMPKAKIAFIPRGATLKEGTDAEYERITNENGRARFTPKTANYYLIVAHAEDKNAKGKGYDSTKYSAALTLFVPQICPCCG